MSEWFSRKRFSGLFVVLGLAVAAPSGLGCNKPAEDKKDDKASKDDDKKKKSKDDDDDSAGKKKKSKDDDDDSAGKKKKSKDDDDDSAGKKKKSKDDDDDSAGKKKKSKDDDDDDSAGKKKKSKDDDDDDDDSASAGKKKKPADDDDDSVAPKKKNLVDVAGSYSVKGAGPDGKGYSGSGVVKKINGEMYDVDWTLGGTKYKGIAFRDGDILSCGWVEAKTGGDNERDLGVIAFLVKDGGNTLDGVWFEPGETSLGKEILSGGSSNLTGLYKITTGETPTTKKKYTGSVNVALKNGVYGMTWTIGTGSSKGLGIRNGDVFSAAFTDGTGAFGVLQYRINKDGTVLSGQWAQGPNAAGLGTETMTKQ